MLAISHTFDTRCSGASHIERGRVTLRFRDPRARLTDKALYDLSYVLHNPFGDRRLDVAHETIGSGIGHLSSAIAKVGPHLPPAITARMKVVSA